MVATRASRRSGVGVGAGEDENRVIAVVTGANSGYGLGICQALLTNLSLPPGHPIPASTPMPTALPPSMRHLLDHSSSEEPTKSISDRDSPTLTIILACRSESKALEARQILLDGHEKDLEKRRKKGIFPAKGWKDGLRIVWEGLDLDNPGLGKAGRDDGLLGFCERLKDKYPYITTLYLNAGMGAFGTIDYLAFCTQILMQGMPKAMAQPGYQNEYKGAMSSDGERGMVWGVNVFAQYILIRELIPLLRRSPESLPFSPRVVYTSSLTAWMSRLHEKPLDDYQLLDYEKSYSASKYMGDLVMCQLDREYNPPNTKERGVRIFTVDPGAVTTSLTRAGFGTNKFLIQIKVFLYYWSFYLCRLLGSPWHPVYADQGALPMLYAALIADMYLLPPNQVPSQKFSVLANRWGNTKVAYGEVDKWEEAEELGKGIVDKCEVLRKEWRRRSGLE
ncbi:hypothetical protein CI109_105116 [Kwoniella shandongensis]|uniref:Uncharacterized protein n=1 Tax=Kwoniella shandongensis TaxID=1734106 RepID=A0A5M6C464_9TREE|nr:uncharacterized protein CI109_001955 [Kwoniella shandongensis]KAA5529530.1 hypothetical protein CI109_001955 [Kwoniella shandongensis]